eukprot:gnl/MRDRNA2_/MRDRNA2_76450_c0_seq1.p1 gnl/MRDRNA2_/MRDRNA2_76450_c0~~gnl/MRDRNA2_/MRDRNA2_76450_c0_seq1.p1  ORF type:complete len:128 (-),score=17.36 gnl/MRDRNA2_/MRDRNA2_76450_c0_seq1:50-433(-)
MLAISSSASLPSDLPLLASDVVIRSRSCAASCTLLLAAAAKRMARLLITMEARIFDLLLPAESDIVPSFCSKSSSTTSAEAEASTFSTGSNAVRNGSTLSNSTSLRVEALRMLALEGDASSTVSTKK